MSLQRSCLAVWLLVVASCGDEGSDFPEPADDLLSAENDVETTAVSPMCAQVFGGAGPTSDWAKYDSAGKLTYKKTSTGDRLADFSFAGYGGGGVKIPDVPVQATVAPSGGDDRAAIQAAIDTVSARPLVNGVRGAVQLEKGKFKLGGVLTISKSGVVLRGRGDGTGASATQIQLTGNPHRFLEIRGSGSLTTTGTAAKITDAYVPAGATRIKVNDARGFAVGDTVVVERPVTAAWVKFMKMDTLVRNNKPQTWLSTSSKARYDRVITRIAGNTVTLDVPLTDSIDGALLNPPGARLIKYSFTGRISQVGVEHLRVIAPVLNAPINQSNFGFISLGGVMDGWVRDVTGVDCLNGMSVGGGSKRITVEDVALVQTAPSNTGAGAPAHYAISGSQVLLARCSSVTNKSFSVVTQAQVAGPNVVLDFVGSGTGPHIQPHQRWATGLLVDGATLTGGAIEFMNRGIMGSGHGWTIGWAVAWNSQASSLTVQRPPGATNFAIGNVGPLKTKSQPGGPSTPLPQGTVDSHGTPVLPSSLYLAQLCERLGPEALANIGYPMSP